MDMSAGSDPAALVLAEIALFWGVALLHMIRLLFVTRLPCADRVQDAAHMAMGAGMTLMVFPAVPVGVLRASAMAFAVLAAAFLTHAVLDKAGHRCQNAAIGAGQAVMAYMFAAPAHPPAYLPPAAAGVLMLCALVHGRRLIDTRTRRYVPGANPTLLVLPHVGTLMTTAAMAWMLAAA